jgi:hypothetical protein
MSEELIARLEIGMPHLRQLLQSVQQKLGFAGLFMMYLGNAAGKVQDRLSRILLGMLRGLETDCGDDGHCRERGQQHDQWQYPTYRPTEFEIQAF